MTYVGTYVEVVLELISIRIAQMVLLSLRRAIGAVVLCCSVTFCVSFSCHCQHQHTFLDFDSGLKTPPPLITVELFEISNLLIIEKIDVLLLISESLNRFNQQRYRKDTQRTFCKTESNGPSKK